MQTDQNLQNSIQNFAPEGNEQKIGNIGPFTLKSGGKDFTEQQLKAPVRGSHVKNIIEDMVIDINSKLVDKLNTILAVEETKITKLIRDVGDQNSGLTKDLKDLKETVEGIIPPPEAPPHITGEENGLF